MLIQNIDKNALHVVYKEKIYPIIEGFADVPHEVGAELLKFPHWNQVIEKVEDKIIKALDKANKVVEAPPQEPPKTDIK